MNKNYLKFSFKNYKINLYNNLGKNNLGIITSRFKYKINKKKYLFINFYLKLNKIIEYKLLYIYKIFNPYNKTYVGLFIYINTSLKLYKRLFIITNNLYLGSIIYITYNKKYLINNIIYLYNIKLYFIIYNIFILYKNHIKYTRSSGSYSLIILHTNKYYTLIQFSSKKYYLIYNNIYVYIGKVYYKINFNNYKYKASIMYLKKFKPKVRGKAQNIVDHPHGGGKGKTRIGLKFITNIWGKLKKGNKTRINRKKLFNFIVINNKNKV